MSAAQLVSNISPAVLEAVSRGRSFINSDEAKAAAKIIKTLARNRTKRASYVAKKRGMSKVGERPGSSLSKYVQYRTDGYELKTQNTLNGNNLLSIPRIDGAFSLAQRLRDIVYLTGFKVCVTVQNVTDQPIYFNLALLSAKTRSDLTSAGDDFFRSYSGTSRAQDFSDTTLTALDRHCLPINEDEHHIHFHDRIIITQNKNDSVGGKIKPQTTTIERWVPIRRQIRFESSVATPETKFTLFNWGGKVGLDIVSSNVTTGSIYKMETRVVSVFKEPMPVVKWK